MTFSSSPAFECGAAPNLANARQSPRVTGKFGVPFIERERSDDAIIILPVF